MRGFGLGEGGTGGGGGGIQIYLRGGFLGEGFAG